MLEKIGQLLEEMRPFIIKCGFAESKYQYLLDLAVEEQDKVYLFVESLYLNEYKAVKAIWNLPIMTPELWKFYETSGIESFRELRMLRKALRKMKNKLEEIINDQENLVN